MFVYCIARIYRRRRLIIGVAIKFYDRIISSFITYNRPFRLEIYHFSNCTFPDAPVWHRNIKSLRNFIHESARKILFLTFLRVSGRTFILFIFAQSLKIVSSSLLIHIKNKAEREEDVFRSIFELAC